VTKEEMGYIASKDGVFLKCPNCGCDIEAYEAFACRLRGLATPVCLGCLADALVWMKKYLVPMLDVALKMLEGGKP